jgi:hypothetical protein
MSPVNRYSTLTILLATGLLLAALWTKCHYVPSRLRIPANNILTSSGAADTSIYFIGSSRTGNGINAPFLQNTIRKPVHILSFAGGTFLANSILARHLQQQPGHKIILVELSSVTPNITAEFLTLLRVNHVNIWPHVYQLLQQDHAWQYRHFYTNLLNDVLLQHVNLSTDVKWLAGTKQPILTQFKPLKGNKCFSDASFLQPAQLQQPWPGAMPDTSHLMQLVRIIQASPASTNSQVYFFLPVNFRSTGELPMVASVWRSLPMQQRIGYPDSLLLRLSQSKHLYDEIHLNEAGSGILSQGWVPILDSLLRSSY